MLKPRHIPLASTPDHEELFIQRYERLLAGARQLTGHWEQAEDLVQDAFIHFTHARPDLGTILDLDGYLFILVRNLHVSQVRRAAGAQKLTLSIADYDSVEIGLRNSDLLTQTKVQDELRRICYYASLRKETSKAASVLILRFFHGYYPSEIAGVLRSSRRAVDEWLGIARREAKLFLTDPGALRFMTRVPGIEPSTVNFTQTSEELLHELREQIFRSRHRACLPVKHLERLYRAEGGGTVDRESLAHIVSCPRCLGEVNRLLDVSPLSDRHPPDMLGPDSPRSGGRGGGRVEWSGGGREEFKRRSERRLKEIREHRPQELRILVNGFNLGSQKVGAELSEQTLNINIDERIGFVEVVSEQGIRLMFFNVGPPPDGAVEQRAWVEFSEGRTLEAALDFSQPWPTLHVVYHDPALKAQAAPSADLILEEAIPLTLPTTHEQSATVEEVGQREQFGLAAERRPLLHRWLPSLVPTLTSHFRLRPSTVMAVIGALLIAALVLIQLRVSTPVVSAAEVLNQSAAAEEAIAGRPDQALHRTINLEERKAGGELISRRRVEVWHSAQKKIKALRLYDEQGYLIAGVWNRENGSQTVYRHGSQPQIISSGSQAATPFNPDHIWSIELSAQNFGALVGQIQAARVERYLTAYVISYQSERSADEYGLLKATLTISRPDLHAIEQSIFLRQSGEVHEYRFIESSYERRPLSRVAPKVFEPEPELLGSVRNDGAPGRRAKPAVVPLPPSPSLSLSPAVAKADLEVEALRLLNQVGADLGEQVSVTRTQEGVLRVTGIVETGVRKSEILRALSSITNHPAVAVEIQTVAEAVARQRPAEASPRALSVQGVDVAREFFPAFADLRRYFSDEEARQFASRMVGRSHTAMRHAGALRRLLNQFSPEDLRHLSAEARSKWLALVQMHARAFEQETARLCLDLQPIFFQSVPADDRPERLEGIDITDDASLAQAVERLFELGSANDQVISSALTISANSAAASAIKTPEFRHALKRAESLAAKIQNQVRKEQ